MNKLFKYRSEEEELMDDLDCSGEVVDQTLRELEIINRLLGGNYVTLRGLDSLFKKHSLKGQKVRIADLGCGGGDMLVLVAKWARRKNLSVELIGIDANPHIIAFARENTVEYPEITYLVQDIFSKEFEEGSYDLVITSLFTHHFNEEQLVNLFSSIKKLSRYGFVNNDLHRHWFAYYSIKMLTRFFSKSEMVRYDAPLSVLRGFRKGELADILMQAGIKSFRLRWMWAFRWQLIF
ncbi:MAG: methyltransferase domain-containing protein [Bacteroidia bacterium]|nr:methyltransferase domain-containing protein [Bacteroidia bacterium]